MSLDLEADVEATAGNAEAVAFAAPPVAVFQGYDSVSGAGRATAVTGKTETVGGASGVSYKVCLDISELAQTLHITQSLSVGYGPFGVEQKMEFIRSLKMTTYCISIVVSARHVLGKDTMTDVEMKAGIKPPGTTEEIKDFVRGYGDSFISARTRGGEYYAVYTFYSETKEEQQTLIVDLKTKGLFSGVSVNAGLQTKLDNFTSSTKTRSSLDQTISGIQNPKLPDADQIIAYSLSFPSLLLDAPAVIDVESAGYEHVPGFGNFGPIPANRKYFVGTGAVGGLTASLVTIQELRDQIVWLQDIYAHYGYSGDAAVTAAAAQTQKDLGAIDEQMQAWQTDPTQTFTPPNLPSLKLGTPALSYAISYSNAYGRSGGEPIADFDPTTYIQEKTRLVMVQLRTGKLVDALIVSYDSLAGPKKFQHGRNGGDLSSPLPIGKDQYVTSVSGRAGQYVDQLNITITGGAKVGGGRDGGTEIPAITPPTGAFVIGFGGRSGKNLDQIQVIFAKISAATWQLPNR